MANFINWIYGSNSQGVFNLWTKQDKRTYSFDINDKKSISETIEKLRNNYDVYYEVCLQENFPPKGKRGKADSALVMPGVWFDLNIAGPNHKNQHLPQNIQEADHFITELPLMPTVEVSTGGGYHLYFLFHEPLVFSSEEDRMRGQELSKKFQQLIIDKGNDYGYRLFNNHDLGRLLRFPGTLNFKQNPPMDVKVIYYLEETRYSPDEILA